MEPCMKGYKIPIEKDAIITSRAAGRYGPIKLSINDVSSGDYATINAQIASIEQKIYRDLKDVDGMNASFDISEIKFLWNAPGNFQSPLVDRTMGVPSSLREFTEFRANTRYMLTDLSGFKTESRVVSKIKEVTDLQEMYAIKDKSGYVLQLERDGFTGENCTYENNNRMFIQFFGGRSFVNDDSNLNNAISLTVNEAANILVKMVIDILKK